MRKQKGQAVVEFAVVFPFMLLFLWVLLYGGLLFKDYLTLSNLARDSARSASIQGSAQYDAIRAQGAQQTILTDLYTWNGDAASFQIANGELNDSVKVTLTATLNTNFPGVGLLTFLGLPESYKIVYSMHKETT
ncbi:MAG: pilus assembly protein [Schwartzia sp.]|nr:pilus assembly protein [Schwartzia sp. (in: firmicutes)]